MERRGLGWTSSCRVIKHRGRQEGLGGRWVASGCPTARRPRLVADHPTLRGGQHRRQAAAGRHDLRSHPGPAPRPIDDGRRPTFRRPSRRPRPAPAAGPTRQGRLRRIFQIFGRGGEPDLRAAAGDTEGAGRRRWMPPRSPVGSRWCGLAVSELVVTPQHHAAAVGVPQAAPRHPEVRG